MAIHATTPQTIQAAIDAGFDSIEHGIGILPEQIRAMATKGIALVPTLSIVPYISEVDIWLEMGVTQDVAEMSAAAVARHHEMVGHAAEAGVLLLAGTDAGIGPHGMVRGEVEELIRAGLEPGKALGAASWSARKFLGLPGIEEGAAADLVAYVVDPRRDIDILASPAIRILDGILLS